MKSPITSIVGYLPRAFTPVLASGLLLALTGCPLLANGQDERVWITQSFDDLKSWGVMHDDLVEGPGDGSQGWSLKTHSRVTRPLMYSRPIGELLRLNRLPLPLITPITLRLTGNFFAPSDARAKLVFRVVRPRTKKFELPPVERSVIEIVGPSNVDKWVSGAAPLELSLTSTSDIEATDRLEFFLEWAPPGSGEPKPVYADDLQVTAIIGRQRQEQQQQVPKPGDKGGNDSKGSKR